MKEKNSFYVIKKITVLVLIVTAIWTGFNYILDKKIKNVENEDEIGLKSLNYNMYENTNLMDNSSVYENSGLEIMNKISINNSKENEGDIKTEINEKDKILNEYKGYGVIAKLKIEKINLETYVLSSYSEQALLISATKYWGGEPNEIGNFCISGHNYINKNMFHNLKKLSIGDEIILITNKTGSINYEIYDIYKVYPNETECLSQNTNGNREITLITCTSDSKKRIIIKAREK